MKPPHEIVWWENGKSMGEFQGDLEKEAALLDRDGFVLNVPLNRVVRKIRGKISVVRLDQQDTHLNPCEAAILANGLLRSRPGIRWTRPQCLEVAGHPRPWDPQARHTCNHWFLSIRKVLQDGRPSPFLLLDRYSTAADGKFARFLDPGYTYILLDYQQRLEQDDEDPTIEEEIR